MQLDGLDSRALVAVPHRGGALPAVPARRTLPRTLLVPDLLLHRFLLFLRSSHLLFGVALSRFHFYDTKQFIIKYSLTSTSLHRI